MPEITDRARRYAYAALSSVYLFTFGAFSRRHQLLISRIAQHFGYHRLGVRPALPVIPADSIVADNADVRLRSCSATEGNMTLTELVTIAQLVATVRPHVLFEIGTFDGRTTLAMSDNAATDAKIFTLDLPAAGVDATALRIEEHERHLIEKTESGGRFRAYADTIGRITQLWGDSAAFDYGPYLGRCEFIFIDGSHAYDYVISDSEAALRMLTPNGTIVWHDFGEWPGVTRALNHLQATDPRFRQLQSIAGTTLAVMQRREGREA